MASTKVTFTLDEATIQRIDRAAATLSIAKSQVIRDAVQNFSDGLGRLSEAERLRMLKIIDEVLPRIPKGDQRLVDKELKEIRRERRSGGRRTPIE